MTMTREKHKMKTIEAENTKELYSDRLGHSREVTFVIEVERRAGVICFEAVNNHIYGRIF